MTESPAPLPAVPSSGASEASPSSTTPPGASVPAPTTERPPSTGATEARADTAAAPDPLAARRDAGVWRHAAAAAAIVWVVSLLLAAGHPRSPDEEILFRLTESMATRLDVAIDPLFGFATRAGRGDKQYPQYPPLQSLLATPLYGMARLTRPLVSDATVLRTVWDTNAYHGGSPDEYWNRLWVVLGFNPLVTALTTLLLWFMARRLAGGDRKAAWLVALAYGLGTLALAHARTFFTEPLAALWVLMALAALLRWADERRRATDSDARPLSNGRGERAAATPAEPEAPPPDEKKDGKDKGKDEKDNLEADEPFPAVGERDEPLAPSSGSGSGARWALIAGLTSAAGLWTRVDSPLFLPGLSLGVLLLAWPTGWRWERSTASIAAAWRGVSWRALFAFGLPVALSLAGVLLFNWWRFGDFRPSGGYEDQPEGVQFATPLLIGLHGFFCSPGKGLFLFSPPLLLAVFGVGLLWRRCRVWTLTWAVSSLVFLVFMSKWQNWAGGWCWGPRHIFQVHPLWMLALAPFLAPPRKSWVKISCLILLVVGFGVQVFGSSQSFIDFYRDFYGMSGGGQSHFTALYSHQEVAAIAQNHTIVRETPRGGVPIPVNFLPAPINDSIYVPQNTQWYGYPLMAKMGYHDFLWLHALGGTKDDAD